MPPSSHAPNPDQRKASPQWRRLLAGGAGICLLVLAGAALLVLPAPWRGTLSALPPSEILVQSARGSAIAWILLLGILVLVVAYNVLVFFIVRDCQRTNASLTSSEHRLASYLDAMPFYVLVHDPQLNPIYVNAAIRRDDRGDRNEAYYHAHYDSWLSEVPVVFSGTHEPYPPDRLPLVRAAHGESAHADDISLVFPTDISPVEAWSVPIRNAAGEITAIVSAFHNIAARRAVEQELASYREHLEQHVAQRTAELAAVNTHLTGRVAQLSAINDISLCVARLDDPASTLQEVARILVDLYAVQAAGIGLFDLVEQQIWLVALEDRSNGRLMPYFGRSIPYTPSTAVALRTSPFVVDDVSALCELPEEIRRDLAARGVKQLLLAPLCARDRTLGGVVLVVDRPRQFTADELRVAQTVAFQVATAIDGLHVTGNAGQNSAPQPAPPPANPDL